MPKVSYAQRVADLAREAPDAVAYVCGDDAIDRATLERETNRLARAYAERGAKPGGLVTIALPNGIELVRACIATWKLGAVPNPIAASLPRAERDALVARADPGLLVGVPEAESGGRPVVPAGFAPGPAVSDTRLPDAVAPHERALASGGSTGQPKLILPSSPASFDPETPSHIFAAERSVLVPGPMSHAVPFSAAFQGYLSGARVVILPRFDARACLAGIERHRIDRVHLVPTMMLRIWRLPERESFDVSSLRFVMTGGAPCPAWLMRGWIDWLGPDVLCEAFGPSERIGGTFITGREWLAHPGSVGRPAAGSRLRILDPETGAECPPDTLGEIHLLPESGPGSTYRYVGSEGQRNADGWESVGDMGWLDADGYLYLGDRRTDMILSGGRNIYPAEVEAALEAHPAVLSSCVIGLPDEDLGSRVHALVQLARDVPDQQLIESVRERLASWKLPRSIERVDHPLRDDAGKVRRSALRAERVEAR